MTEEEAQETKAFEQIEDLTVAQDQAEQAKGGSSLSINFGAIDLTYRPHKDE